MSFLKQAAAFCLGLGVALLAGYLFPKSEHWSLWGIGILFAGYFAFVLWLAGAFRLRSNSLWALLMLIGTYSFASALALGGFVLGVNLEKQMGYVEGYSIVGQTLYTITRMLIYSLGLYGALLLAEQPISLRLNLIIAAGSVLITSVVDYLLVHYFAISPLNEIRGQIYFAVLSACYLPFAGLVIIRHGQDGRSGNVGGPQ